MIPVSNKIERTVTLKATPSQVWEKSFASPDALTSWFPNKIEGDFKVGESFFMIFSEDETEHRCECKVTTFEPGTCFEFIWHPGVSANLAEFPEAEATAVKFVLEANPAGNTQVTMTESGFGKIAKKRRQMAFDSNNTGWNVEMAKLPKSY